MNVGFPCLSSKLEWDAIDPFWIDVFSIALSCQSMIGVLSFLDYDKSLEKISRESLDQCKS